MKRNDSILAHGLRTITQEEYDSMWRDVMGELRMREEELPGWPAVRF